VSRIDLTIPTERSSSDDPKSCLSFRYLRNKYDSARVPAIVELGLRMLVPIAEELRRNSHEVSDPAAGKMFGITGMRCRIGKSEFAISLWPPPDGDEWRIQTGWVRTRKPSRETTQSENSIKPILETLEHVVARMDGVRELRWLSLQESENEYRSLSRKNESGLPTGSKSR
jgi:hypothetical protein